MNKYNPETLTAVKESIAHHEDNLHNWSKIVDSKTKSEAITAEENMVKVLKGLLPKEEFEIGDRVKILNSSLCSCTIDIGEIYDIKGEKIYTKEDKCFWIHGFEHNCCPHLASELQKMEGSMSQYESIKAEINALNGNSTLKEVDDILQKITNKDKDSIEIKINNFHSDSDGALIDVYSANANNRGSDSCFKEFHYKSQCDKIEALKDALLWFLKYSDIKKDLVGQEVTIGTETLIATIGDKKYKIAIQSPVVAQVIEEA